MTELFSVTQEVKDYNDKYTTLNNKERNHISIRSIPEFWRNKSTTAFIEQNKSIIKTKRGKNGGTLVDKPLFDFFKRWLNGVSEYKHSRTEVQFFDTFESIVNATKKNIDLKRQYKCLHYAIDAVLIERIDNFGDYDTDKEKFDGITIFEYDEDYHSNKYQKVKDKSRMKNIIRELRKYFDVINIYRIPAKDSSKFLLYAIPYFGCIDTSYAVDPLFSFLTTYNNFDNK